MNTVRRALMAKPYRSRSPGRSPLRRAQPEGLVVGHEGGSRALKRRTLTDVSLPPTVRGLSRPPHDRFTRDGEAKRQPARTKPPNARQPRQRPLTGRRIQAGYHGLDVAPAHLVASAPHAPALLTPPTSRINSPGEIHLVVGDVCDSDAYGRSPAGRLAPLPNPAKALLGPGIDG